MQDKQIIELINKYHDGTISPEGRTILESWYLKQASVNNYDLSKKDIDHNLEIIEKGLPLKYNTSLAMLWPRSIAVAAILICISFGMYFYINYNDDPNNGYVDIEIKKEIVPGSNKAILTLADGSKISLTDANSGDLVKENGIKITKTADGQLVYEVRQTKETQTDGSDYKDKITYNTLETPRGGQYQIILPDGSKVWLNAASILRYPSNFASHKERKVELYGEAYFEVFKDKLHPFIVRTNKQEIKVLGTHFNISAYSDESQVKTTLLEGSVMVYNPDINGDKVKLIPGQQSVSDGKSIKVNSVDLEGVIAWKNGYFRFDDESLESIMSKISRWYNVDINWQDESVKSELFAAVTTRFVNVSNLLKMLEQTGDVKFDVRDGKITVSKKR